MSIDRLLDIVRGAVGLTQDDPAFQALCGPGEPPWRARELATLSTCALFLRGCLAWAAAKVDPSLGQRCAACDARGLVRTRYDDPSGPSASVCLDCDGTGGMPSGVPPRLWAPYKLQMAMADLVAVCDSISIDQTWPWPWDLARGQLRPGSINVVGAAGHEHVYLVESIERDGWPDGSIELTAIEAGQVDAAGRQCVRRKRHEISPDGIDRTWGFPLPPRATHPKDIIALPIGRATAPEVGSDPEIRRPVTWILDPRPLLEGT